MKNHHIPDFSRNSYISQDVRLYMLRNRINQTEFASLIGVTQSTLSGYILGRYSPSPTVMARIQEIVPPGYYERMRV